MPTFISGVECRPPEQNLQILEAGDSLPIFIVDQNVLIFTLRVRYVLCFGPAAMVAGPKSA